MLPAEGPADQVSGVVFEGDGRGAWDQDLEDCPSRLLGRQSNMCEHNMCEQKLTSRQGRRSGESTEKELVRKREGLDLCEVNCSGTELMGAIKLTYGYN